MLRNLHEELSKRKVSIMTLILRLDNGVGCKLYVCRSEMCLIVSGCVSVLFLHRQYIQLQILFQNEGR